ncbi:MAG: hybrid sensor histidine kinase/response regulator [Desulfobacteraceae bacterium]|nr:hybrid sensor histidine kinase/response regulator [Desulfobacteraceae bacterium]
MSADEIKKDIILVVDDNPVNLHVLLECLNQSGFETLIARSGESAIRQINFARPDIILLDIMMPGIDGFETCRLLKEDESTKDIPIIFMTALSETIDKIKGFEMGAIDYITKPFHQDEVLARITTHLTIQRQKKELAELNARLAESNATKDKFFSIIAHDLKNIFNSLIGGSQILAESIDTLSKEKIGMFAEEMFSSAQTAYELLENLLNWARMQKGSIEFKQEPIDLSDLVLTNIINFQNHADMKDIELLHSVEAGTIAYADPNMVNTVLRNLISNAIKFTGNRGRIIISANFFDQIIEVSVSDNGVGISQENADKLFRIDSKFRTTGTAGEKGSGLGLSLCREFIENNDGKIWIDSELGEGTSFWFTLPKG